MRKFAQIFTVILIFSWSRESAGATLTGARLEAYRWKLMVDQWSNIRSKKCKFRVATNFSFYREKSVGWNFQLYFPDLCDQI